MGKFTATFAAALFSASAFANVGLENAKAAVEFDDNGNLVSLKNKLDNVDYAGGQGLWRMIYQQGDLLEEPVESENVPVKAEKIGDSEIKLSYGGEFPATVKCVLDDDTVRFSAVVKNESKDKILREFQFPMIKNVQLSKDVRLINSVGGGRQIRNFRGYVAGAQTQYKSQDNKAVERYAPYPRSRTMNFFVLEDSKCALYFASCDPNFEITLHLARFRKENDKFKWLDIAMVKYPFIKSGESYSTAPFEISPHRGDWRVSAKKFRAAADKWFTVAKAPSSIKNSNGWQRMILRHQYGRILFPYTDLVKIEKAGAECGIDTMLMFGWWREGMDAGYPDYSPETSQGGDEALRANIKKFQSAGGKVIMYFNGQLIDASTDFYKKTGEKICVKTSSGLPHIERYPFGGDGTGLRVLGHKTFTTACHATPEWENVLKGYVDRALSMGVDGVFLDQLGNGSEICWDKSHGHKVPCIDMMKYKCDLIGRIRAYLKSKKPDASFGVEYVGDSTSMHCDFIHNCAIDYNFGGNEKNGKPWLKCVPVFRYAFPEVRVSDRTIRDDSDIERRVNTALMWGWSSDIEIYRCRATIDSAPHYKQYLAKADALRDKYRPLIMNGTYRDRDLATCSNDKLDFTVFENDDEIGVFATNTWRPSESGEISVAGAKFVRAEGLGNFKVSDGKTSQKVSLKRNALALLIYKKNK